ncbi:hypothetical protein FD755_017806, partial [Muntiacus reevesi]
MVLVLHHILIAVVQFFRRGQQVFLKPDEPPPPPPQPCADSLQGTVCMYVINSHSALQRVGVQAQVLRPGWYPPWCLL